MNTGDTGGVPQVEVPGVDDALEPPEVLAAQERRLSYGERLERRVQRRGGARLCVGIDPSPAALELLEPARQLLQGAHGVGGRATRAGAIERFCAMVIEASRDHAVAVKLQAAWFEQAGSPGMRALERAVEYARTAGLLVVLDAKRGDVPHSMRAYAEAWLGSHAGSGAGADAMTISPYAGPDSIAAACEVAHARDAQVYVLVLTSNPGAAAFQEVETAEGEWWHRVARAVAGLGAGAVVGATRLDQLATARDLMPAAPLLVPGIGAQGGSAGEALGRLEREGAQPALATASRSLLPAQPRDGAGFRDAVRSEIAELSGDTIGPFG